MDISGLLADVNRWWIERSRRAWTPPPPSRRDAFSRVRASVDDRSTDRAGVVLLGPRRVGKSTILMQLVDELLVGGWPPHRLLFVDFDDERLDKLGPDQVSDPDLLLASVPDPQGSTAPLIVLLDEIQCVSDWPRWLKRRIDRRDGTRFIVTGSSAAELNAGGVASGVGRWDEIPLEGLTLREYLRLRARPEEAELDVLGREPNALERWLGSGGYPGLVAVDHQKARELIRQDVERAIRKDLRRAGVDTEQVLRLFVHLASDSGATFNATHRAADLSVDRKSIAEWLRVLLTTHLVSELPRLAARKPGARPKPSRQLQARPKIHATLHGLISAFAPVPTPLERAPYRGAAFEAVVFAELRALARTVPGSSLAYYREDDSELDFVFTSKDHRVAIEVTSSIEFGHKLEATRSAAAQVGASATLLVHGGVVSSQRAGVACVPLQDFLLDPSRHVLTDPDAADAG